jgi:hypothetical protein
MHVLFFELLASSPVTQKSLDTQTDCVQELVLDQVLATVYLSDKPDLGADEIDAYLELITKQDLDRSAFDGKTHSLSEAVNKKLLCCKAESLKMSLSDDEVDRKLEEVGLPPEHQIILSEKWHYYDVNEFKEAVREMFVSSMSQGFEVESRLVIAEADALAYYDSNPVWLEAEYEIETAFVPFNSTKEQARLQRKLEKLVKTGHGYSVAWENPVIVKASEISATNLFLLDLKPSEIYLKLVDNGFVLFKMLAVKPRRLKSFIERKNEIINILRNERHPHSLQEINQELQAKAVINYPKQY